MLSRFIKPQIESDFKKMVTTENSPFKGVWRFYVLEDNHKNVWAGLDEEKKSELKKTAISSVLAALKDLDFSGPFPGYECFLRLEEEKQLERGYTQDAKITLCIHKPGQLVMTWTYFIDVCTNMDNMHFCMYDNY